MMRRKLLFLILLFVGIGLFCFKPAKILAQTCSGSGSVNYTSYQCNYDGFRGTYFCSSNGTDYNGGSCGWHGGMCSFEVNHEERCNASSSSCSVTNQCMGGGCYDPGGCNVCNPSCSNSCGQGDGCGGSCGSSDVGDYSCGSCSWNCGGNSRWCSYTCGGGFSQSCACRECEDCSPSCGQARNCGGNCTNADNYCAYGGWQNIASPTCGGSTQYRDGANACGGGCARQYQGCYQCEPCTLQCGQARNCGAANCSTAHGVTPGVVSLASPDGSAADPTIYLNQNITLSWNNNETNHSETDQYIYEVWDGGSRLVNSTVGGGTNSVAYAIPQRGRLYYWRVIARNNTCTGLPAGSHDSPSWSAAGYFRWDSPPTFTNNPPGANFILQNQLAANVPIANTGHGYSGNHICETIFNESDRVRFVVTVGDPDGGDDIETVRVNIVNRNTAAVAASVIADTISTGMTRSLSGSIAWDGATPVTVGAISGNNRTVTFMVDLSSLPEGGPNNIYRFDVIVTDVYGVGSGTINSNRNLKMWNCRVATRGTIYDGSSGQGCPSIGFGVPVGAGFNFQTLNFVEQSAIASVVDVNMTRTSDATYGANDLLWFGSYLPTFNTVEGTGRQTRIVDLGIGTTEPCNTQVDANLADPYASSPALQVDFSWIQNQDPWFQVVGSGAKAGNRLSNNVPVTCTVAPTNGCIGALTVGSTAATGVGVSSSGLINAVGTLSYNAGCPSCTAGWPNNWFNAGRNLMKENYLYGYFYREYQDKLGLGTTLAGNHSISDIGTSGVYFVGGDLNIDADKVVPAGNFLMVVVQGAITINNNVNVLEGVYTADRDIVAGGNADTILRVNGILHSGANVTLTRGYNTHSLNNKNPGIKVTYRPDFLFSMPMKVSQILSGYRAGY